MESAATGLRSPGDSPGKTPPAPLSRLGNAAALGRGVVVDPHTGVDRWWLDAKLAVSALSMCLSSYEKRSPVVR